MEKIDKRPASNAQKVFIMEMAADAGWGDDDLDELSVSQANERIEILKDELGIYDQN